MSDRAGVSVDSVDHRTSRDDPQLPSEKLRRVQRYARALLDGVAVAEQVEEDWPEFYRLAAAFTDAYGSSRLEHLRASTSLFEGWGDEDPITDEDRAFLVRLFNEVQDVLRSRAAAGVSAARSEKSGGGAP